jgi:hypothetical protein
MPSVNTQCQTDSVYFDLSNAFDIVPHNILLRKLTNSGLSSGYVNWFHSYLANRQSCVRISGTLSSSYVVKSDVPQGSTLGPLLFNIFINYICDSIFYSKYILFADDLKIYRNINNVRGCKRLQSDINSEQNWCFENGMTLKVGKTTIISFTRKTVGFHFNKKLSNNPILRSQCVKDLAVLLGSKLYFLHHVDYISSQGLKMLGLIRYITSSFSTPHSLSVLYTTLVRPKLEYASVAWNSITRTDSSKLETVQIKFATLYHSRFCAGVCGSNYEGMLSRLNISTLRSRRKHLDALFLINAFKNKISFSSIFDTVNLRIPSRRIRDFLPSWLTTISRTALQLDVFLLLTSYVRKLTFSVRTKLRFLTSLNFTYSYTC